MHFIKAKDAKSQCYELVSEPPELLGSVKVLTLREETKFIETAWSSNGGIGQILCRLGAYFQIQTVSIQTS